MEYLALEIFNLSGTGSKYAFLPEDATITITSTSEIFSSGDVWSYSFQLNTRANAHIFGTCGELHGSRLHELIDKRRARLWVEGLPLYLGYLKLSEEVDVNEDGDIDVSFESGQKTFEKLIEGAKANQVPMISDVRFGVALYRKRWASVLLNLRLTPRIYTGIIDLNFLNAENIQCAMESDGEDDYSSVQQYPRMVFPKGRFDNLISGIPDEEINCLNTDYPYDDAHPYCNIAFCYQKQGYTRKNQDGGTYEDYSSEPEAQRGYEVMPANRVNSAPNFFVIYWIKALFKHLGIYIEENQMNDVEDLRRLFFVNTKCAYKEPEHLRDGQKYDGSLGKYQFGSDGDLVPEHFGNLVSYKDLSTFPFSTIKRWDAPSDLMRSEESHFDCVDFAQGKWIDDISGEDVSDQCPTLKSIDVKVASIVGMSEDARQKYDGQRGGVKSQAKNRFLHDAIATSDCFPNVDISEVIRAIEDGFGVRFLFNDSYQRVRIVLLRNIFRNEEVQSLKCDIISEEKQENSIRGFRMTYGKTEDTHFYYKGFDDKLSHQPTLWHDTSDTHDYSHWDLDADYSKLINTVSAFDKTCYVTKNTGNSYGIKVDKDAKRSDDLHPSLFEFAGFMDAEDGDCTGEDDTIKTIKVGFTPAIVNDINFEQERNAMTEDERAPQYALFVEETMRPRRFDLGDRTAPESYNDSDAFYDVIKLYNGDNGKSNGIVKPGEFTLTSDMFAIKGGLELAISYLYAPLRFAHCRIGDIRVEGHVNEGFRLYLQDNFEPNDDGVSPIETHDWGLTLGIMRGTGSDAYINYSDDPDDDVNDTWDIVPGSHATVHPDICDSYGKQWDYEGGKTISSAGEAIQAMQDMFPNSNFDLIYDSEHTLRDSTTYISGIGYFSVKNNAGDAIVIITASVIGGTTKTHTFEHLADYIESMSGMTEEDIYAYDARNASVIIEVGSSGERRATLLWLQQYAFTDCPKPRIIIDGDSTLSRYGRFSLKLRAEKPNPYFDPTQPENSTTNRRYLEITNPNLRRRGLCDQFYKEYSYWVRNARVAKFTVKMELVQLLAIDKTAKVTIGDITGFIRKMQYSISNKAGLGEVTIEIMYI